MSPGDLVLIVGNVLYPGESPYGIFWSDEPTELLEEWGWDVAGVCNCILLWDGKFTPFNKEDLRVVNEELILHISKSRL